MNIQGNRMLTPNEVILSGNEGLADFGKFGDDRSEGPPRPRIGDVLSIHLSQQGNSVAEWNLTVYVEIAQGWFQLGPTFVTVPPVPTNVGDPPARTVGFAFCPGAIGWKVLATCETDGENADLVIQSSKTSGGATFGVTPNVFAPPG